jgi:hypothetical protein
MHASLTERQQGSTEQQRTDGPHDHSGELSEQELRCIAGGGLATELNAFVYQQRNAC